MRVSTGLEVMIANKSYMNKRIGLITNHTGVGPELDQNIDLMLKQGYKITALFSPEHGLFGDYPDGEYVESSMYPGTGIPIYSLFGETQQPTQDMLQDVDVLIFDIQDIGARYYTYMSTMLLSLEAASANDIEFVVLDRANPIGGIAVEGNVTRPSWISPVAYAHIAIRHGMTPGEIAMFVASEKGLARPSVVPLKNWSRDMYFPDTGLPWVPTSPSAPSIEMALLYPGTCLLEGTNVSEGRGTSVPFQVLGAPWIDGPELSQTLNEMGLPGIRTRPVYFRPSFSKWTNQVCRGIQIHILEPEKVQPVELGVRLVFALRDLYPDDFELTPPGPDRKHFLDLLCGGDQLSAALADDDSPESLLSIWSQEAEEFKKKRQDYLIYV
ncbi:MAG: exo-beta-N-acetylmuramidase NamZ domain-containing protein [Bacillota bacterium]|jgi:uncharacterized protein YbbC (DUF1343 family)|nr:DUF1343 domain-containing protein [Candidatus Fermentithermobacillaceae bacterium]